MLIAMRRLALSLLFGALALAGCKDKSSPAGGAKAGGKVASCDVIAKAYSCKQYDDGNLALGADYLKKICDGMEGTFALAPCPAAKRLGACVKQEGTDVVYEGYPIAAADVAKDCTSREGTWQKP